MSSAPSESRRATSYSSKVVDHMIAKGYSFDSLAEFLGLRKGVLIREIYTGPVNETIDADIRSALDMS